MTPYRQWVVRNGGGPAFRDPSHKPIAAGPIACHVMRITNIYADDTRFKNERNYTADIADLLGANITAAVRASVFDTLATAGVPCALVTL